MEDFHRFLLILSGAVIIGKMKSADVYKRQFGNTYQYYPVVSEEDFRKGTLRNVISKYFNNSYLSAVSSLVKEEDISLDDLKRLINEVEQAHQK